MENMNIGSKNNNNNNNKRKNISHAAAVDHTVVDDDEEKKIDRFFALINRIREARDLLNSNYGAAGAGEGVKQTENYYLNNDNNKRRKNKQVQNDQEEQYHTMPTPMKAWKPLFQLEDFMDHEHLLHFNVPPPTTFGSSSFSNVLPQKQDSAEEGLDLRLSL